MDFGDAFGMDIRVTKEIEHDGKPARIVSGSRLYTTDVKDLWDALTNPERVPRWFLPVSGDLKVGGRYQLKGFAGGDITRCDKARALDVTWEVGDNISWLQIRLTPEQGGTRLTLDHIMLKDEQGESHWKTYGPGATGVGWELSFLALGYHLSNDGIQIDPEAYQKWTMSDNGKAFARNSAKAWGEAHISSGEDEQIALGMAQATAKFYSGE